MVGPWSVWPTGCPRPSRRRSPARTGPCRRASAPSCAGVRCEECTVNTLCQRKTRQQTVRLVSERCSVPCWLTARSPARSRRRPPRLPPPQQRTCHTTIQRASVQLLLTSHRFKLTGGPRLTLCGSRPCCSRRHCPCLPLPPPHQTTRCCHPRPKRTRTKRTSRRLRLHPT